mgnify:CR=1 FL=1
MTVAKRIDGKAKAAELAKSITKDTAALLDEHGITPGLAVVIIGEDPASEVYVRNKKRTAESCGFHSVQHTLAEDVSQADVLQLIDELNNDDAIHGILVQLPLPAHIGTENVIERIHPDQDVDGFHPYSVGRLALRQPVLRPCTPRGVITLLEKTGQEIRGMDAVVVGASNIVGRPMSLELLLAGCTVTTCHRFTKDLEAHVRRADLLIVAVGKMGIVDAEWIKPGAVVIDVAMNRNKEGKLVGDLDFEAARERAGWITPVPGGVGPMTVATLLQNTADAADQLHK